ncbi:dynamin family protein [Alicyclobacillus mengziensis]|uniref:Dynamin family protein n=1 Tax=Alicyclobacillus mengziensis TaxID=2931921 RepID=A0A9X7W416_9BACL|nr:dynamin family protein [Alicyclobacillus mengziensis]QSO49058.1 dynamin family protein [Alicyclobacillus mengziensis]
MRQNERVLEDIETIQKITPNHLTTLADELAHSGMHEAASRIQDLKRRLQSPPDSVRVALCGLFSAGKSSLINAFVGTSVAATGAVPTTAAVNEIEWDTGQGRVILMDTPGIDSTDEAHQQATEAALHLADVVCLVADYGHVESEENLEFARMLSERGVHLIFVVHQIDKHVEFELPFTVFAHRVEDSLLDYGVHYNALFYTAVRDTPHNQQTALRGYLEDLSAQRTDIVTKSVVGNTLSVIREAVADAMSDRRSEVQQTVEELLGEVPIDDEEAALWFHHKDASLRQAEAEVEQLEQGVRREYDKAHEEFSRSIDLGQIAPYDTTELGRRYVESLRPGFKVGWLNAKKRTEEEQRHRLDAFRKDLQNHLRQSLVWPLQRDLRAFVYHSEWASESLVQGLDSLDIEIPKEVFDEAVNQGALLSTQYPYQYVKEVVGRVKTMVKSRLNQIMAPWFDEMLTALSASLHEQQQVITKLRTECHAIEAWMDLEREEEELFSTYTRILETQAE